MFCLSSLLVAFIFMCFSSLEKTSFFKLDSFSTHPRQIPFLSSLLSLASIETMIDLQSIKEFSYALCLLDNILTDSRSIKISGFLLDRISTAFRSIEIFGFILDRISTASSIHRAKFLYSLFAR